MPSTKSIYASVFDSSYKIADSTNIKNQGASYTRIAVPNFELAPNTSFPTIDNDMELEQENGVMELPEYKNFIKIINIFIAKCISNGLIVKENICCDNCLQQLLEEYNTPSKIGYIYYLSSGMENVVRQVDEIDLGSNKIEIDIGWGFFENKERKSLSDEHKKKTFIGLLNHIILETKIKIEISPSTVQNKLTLFVDVE
jgi:hypothetical protein